MSAKTARALKKPSLQTANVRIIMKNFVAISQTVAEIWQFLDLSKWRPSAIFDLLQACLELDHP